MLLLQLILENIKCQIIKCAYAIIINANTQFMHILKQFFGGYNFSYVKISKSQT